jgi:hypothetical protein
MCLSGPEQSFAMLVSVPSTQSVRRVEGVKKGASKSEKRKEMQLSCKKVQASNECKKGVKMCKQVTSVKKV